MRLLELFQSTYKYEFHKVASLATKKNYDVKFRDDQDQLVVVKCYYRPEWKAYELDFTRGGDFKITGKGDAPKIFGTVISIIKDLIEKEKFEYLYFTAEEESRRKFYTALIRRVSASSDFKPVIGDQLKDTKLQRWFANANGHPFILKKNHAAS